MTQRYRTYLKKKMDFVDSLRQAFSLNDPMQLNQEVKSVLQQQRDKIRRLNQDGASGTDTVRFFSEMVDTLLRVHWDHVEMSVPDEACFVAIVAVGGYGRMELCPQSDIDLLILTSPDPESQELFQVEVLVRSLWDFGFTVGHSVRSVAQCLEVSSQDPETWTSFLNERFVAGNYSLYREFAQAIGKQLPPSKIKKLVASKLQERERRQL